MDNIFSQKLFAISTVKQSKVKGDVSDELGLNCIARGLQLHEVWLISCIILGSTR
jgi:hypothetical protein